MFKTAQLISMISATLVVGSTQAALVGFEAESGTLGAKFDPVQSDAGALGGEFIEIETRDGSNNNPVSADRVASYSVTLDPGEYDLYARLYVDGGVTNDSFFYGNGFGAKNPSSDADWITSNGQWNLGSGDIENAYFWVNLSEYTGQSGEGGITLTTAGGTETFQIGGREEGMRIDAFVFGTTGETYTEQQLEAAVPEPGSLALIGLSGMCLLRRRRG